MQATKSPRPKGRESVLSSLNVAIGALDLAKESSSTIPAGATFDSTKVLLVVIRDTLINEASYVELGLVCADVCQALDRGTNRRRAGQLNQSVLEAVERLKMTVAEIQENVLRRSKRNPISRFFHKDDHKAIAAWKLYLNGILHVLNTELAKNTHVTVSSIRQGAANTHAIVSNVRRDTLSADNDVPAVRHSVPNTHATDSSVRRNTLKSREDTDGRNTATHASAPEESPPPPSRNTHGTIPDIRQDIVKAGTIISEVHRDVANTRVMVRNILKSQEGAGNRDQSTQDSIPGELPPPPPRIFFGRGELTEKIISFAERLTPIALIGAGGIGKTSTALTALHDDRIKQRFGQDRRFIRCDKFPPSLPHFLRRLSKTIGAGIENPEDLTPLRPFLSSRDMFIVLDNAESILDPQGTGAQETYAAVEELSQLSNICLCITSRISTVPPDCEWLHIPTLSMEAACDTFYRIYKHGKRSDVVTSILEQLDFHPLSITLLATVAQHNVWDTDQLASEWDKRRTDMLQTEHNKSLAAAIELSLSSLMFQELGPDARDLLGVVAFFPQGIDKNNIDWLFPTITGRKNIFDKFCVLSLTYRNEGFVTMLAPIRDYLSPKDPTSAPLLCSTKERYFSRLSVDVEPGKPGFEEARWIRSEDVNVEHLLHVFTTIKATSSGVWDGCLDFMKHLSWHKPRLVVFGPKIEALPDDHPSKLECLYQLSRLLRNVGNHAECKRLLTHILKLSRERGDDYQLTRTLRRLSGVHSAMDLYEEGIQEAKEALEISERLGVEVEQADCLMNLAWLLNYDKQLDAAEEAASRAINLLLGKGEQYLVSRCHHALGTICQSKGDTQEAIHHFEMALGIASSFHWLNVLFHVHFSMAALFSDQGRFDDAHAHLGHAKSHAVDDLDAYHLARVMWLRAGFWHRQHRLGEAKSEASCAVDAFEKLGATNDAEGVRELLWQIDREARSGRSDELDGDDRAAKFE